MPQPFFSKNASPYNPAIATCNPHPFMQKCLPHLQEARYLYSCTRWLSRIRNYATFFIQFFPSMIQAIMTLVSLSSMALTILAEVSTIVSYDGNSWQGFIWKFV